MQPPQLELIPGTRLTVNAKEMLDMPVWPCEQCDGTGYGRGGSRCACREEDDAAESRRRNFKLILGNAHDQDKA